MAAQSTNDANNDRPGGTLDRIATAADIDPQTRARFRAAFARLPRIQKEILRAHCRGKLSYGEIAVLMQVSEDFVEQQMAKSIYKLMTEMERDNRRWWKRWF